jgi:hypothetical protein
MTEPLRLAVLIDADNASPKIAAALLQNIAKHGDAAVRRIYGDFSGTQLKSWLDILPEHALQAQHFSANVAGKNATDIALVIDAMDLLHSGRFDGFCLVSSDSDFTRLATRIREQGLKVYGYGEKAKTPQSFVQACQTFIFTDKFAKPKQPVKATKPRERGAVDAVPLLKKALDRMQPDKQGWYSLIEMGKKIREIDKNHKHGSYGASTLSMLVKKCGAFELGIDEAKGLARPLASVDQGQRTTAPILPIEQCQ